MVTRTFGFGLPGDTPANVRSTSSRSISFRSAQSCAAIVAALVSGSSCEAASAMLSAAFWRLVRSDA